MCESTLAINLIYFSCNCWCRLTEEEDSIPTGPPRTKNELLFDDSLIYDPDSVVIQNIDHDGVEANSSPIISANTGPTSFAAEELTLIGTVM
jgi:hypothetical protein